MKPSSTTPLQNITTNAPGQAGQSLNTVSNAPLSRAEPASGAPSSSEANGEAIANVIEEVLEASVRAGTPDYIHIKQAFKPHEWRIIVASLRSESVAHEWKLVPMEPTLEWVEQVSRQCKVGEREARNWILDVLCAAPSPTGKKESGNG